MDSFNMLGDDARALERDELASSAVQGSATQTLVEAARQFDIVAPYQRDATMYGFDGMRRGDPAITMPVPAAGWNYVVYDGYTIQNYVQWGLTGVAEPSQYCFIRVGAYGAPGTRFEFYTRVFTDGRAVYRTESEGELPREVVRFIELLGIDPATFDPSQSQGPETFDSSIDFVASAMSGSERPFTADQVRDLAYYLATNKGGERLQG